LIEKISIPGNKFENFDISYIDPSTGRYYLADRSNAAVDVFDTKANKYLFRVGGFVGAKERSSVSGPDGVVALPERKEVWAGDGDSTVKVIDVSVDPARLVATFSTGGKARVDEMAYDPKDGLVLAANNADKPAFVSLISTKDRSVVAKVVIGEASDGIEQPAYVPETGLFYFSVPILSGDKTHGAVAVFDPQSMKVQKFIPVNNCGPTGLAKGPGAKLVVGCGADATADGKSPGTVILDLRTETTTVVPQVGGEDEVWYNARANQYYTASRDMVGGAVLGVIDAGTDAWVANLPTSKNAHSVAADPDTNEIFVPLTSGDGCAAGCIGVYRAR